MGDNYNKLLNISCAAVISNSKILLIQRVKPPYKGYWTLPGGKIEFGEHPEEAALREVKEETDLDCKSEGLKGVASEIVHNNGTKVAHFMLYICRLKPLHTNIQIKNEGDLKWFDLKKLDGEKIAPSDVAMIKEFILKENKTNFHKIKMVENKGEYFMEEFRK